MNLNDFFEQALFQIGATDITVAVVGILILAIALAAGLLILLERRLFPVFFKSQQVDEPAQRRIRLMTRISLFLLLLLVFLPILGLNEPLFGGKDAEEGLVTPTFAIRLTHLVGLTLIWHLARLSDLLLSGVYLKNIFEQRDGKKMPRYQYREKPKTFSNRAVQSVVYLLAVVFVITVFQLDTSLFTITVGEKAVPITINRILFAVLVLLIARLFNWILVQLVLFRYYQRKEIDVGSQYAINQLVRYIIYIIAVLAALQTLGINMTLIWGGAAALLLGVGLGLQQTFNDFFSGVLLLLERSVEVGDVVDVGGLVGTVRQIGLRTSKIQTRDNIMVIVPNSKLVVDNVVNWSHNDKNARFYVAVGVAYGSDTELVRELLTKVAREHDRVHTFPAPFVRFKEFGDSSLNVEMHFWSSEHIPIEDVKSDLRFTIDQAFRENNVSIPFPQRDVWFRNDPEGEGS